MMENPAGRVDVLLLRLFERVTLQFEAETGFTGAWALIQAQAEQAARKVQAAFTEASQ